MDLSFIFGNVYQSINFKKFAVVTVIILKYTIFHYFHTYIISIILNNESLVFDNLSQ